MADLSKWRKFQKTLREKMTQSYSLRRRSRNYSINRKIISKTVRLC